MRKRQAISSVKRINSFLIVFLLSILLLIGRAVQIQAIDAAGNAEAAAASITYSATLKAQRGQITDRNGELLAQDLPAFRVVADPTSIKTNGNNPESMKAEDIAKAEQAPEAIAGILIRYLGGSKSDYLPKLTQTEDENGNSIQYVVLKRKVLADVYQQMMQELNDAGWYGIYGENDPVRYYPGGTLASDVLGFTNSEGDGAFGLEATLNDQLKGVDGTQTYQAASFGTIPLGDNTLVPAQDGSSFQLTIDAELQWMAQQQVQSVQEDTQARFAAVIVMAVDTGEILAIANSPTFDSNDPGDADPANLANRAVTDAYEPGSVQKVITMACLLDQGLITPDTHVEVPSQIASGGGYINDDSPHGTLYLTARGVLANSSNIGTVEMARQLDKETFANYLDSFGYGKATGIEIPGESASMGIVPQADMADYTLDQISFGQGLSVTAVQEAAAVAAAVNGGVYHTPTVLKSGTTADGDQIEINRTEAHRVISEEASAAVVSMMEAGVASAEISGYENRMIAGYRMAGKSGTAQKIGEYGSYNGGYTGSYVAVAPVEDPKILVYAVVDEPKTNYYGGVVAMPIARDLMAMALPRYGVLPGDVPAYTDPLTYEP